MALLTVAAISRAGVDVAGAAATAGAGGDTFANTGYEVVEVKNGSGSPITVTLDFKPTVYDVAPVTDPTVTIAAGITKAIGPFPPSLYNDTSGLAKITYSDVTTVTVKALRFTPTP